MQAEIVLQQILTLGILVAVGVVASAFRALDTGARDLLAKIIFNVTLPLLLLTNFSRMDMTPELLLNSLSMIWLAFAAMMLMLLTGWLGSAVLHLPRSEAAIFKTHAVFGNTVYLGYPVVHALFGNEGLLYAGMLQLVVNILMWTVGVVLLSSSDGVPIKRNILKVFNVNTFAILVGFAMFVAGLKLPAFLMKPLEGLGNSNLYLSMLYMGSMVYHSDIRGTLGKGVVYAMAFHKLILIPLLLLAVFGALPRLVGYGPDPLVASVLIVLLSMPCMANIVILARIFGADDRLATANVFVTTVLSLMTLPLVVYLMGIVL